MQYDTENAYPNKKILTSSQFLLYERSPQEFYTRYVLGVKLKVSNAMNAGKLFAAMCADRSFDYKKAFEELKVRPKRLLGVMEDAINHISEMPKKNCEYVLMPKFKNGWRIRATLDMYIPENPDDVEFKTGQTEWTQERANFSDQLTFQSLAHKLAKGMPFRKIFLNWVDFRANATKLIRTFKTSRSDKALDMMSARVEAVIENIEAENWTKPIYSYC